MKRSNTHVMKWYGRSSIASVGFEFVRLWWYDELDLRKKSTIFCCPMSVLPNQSRTQFEARILSSCWFRKPSFSNAFSAISWLAISSLKRRKLIIFLFRRTCCAWASETSDVFADRNNRQRCAERRTRSDSFLLSIMHKDPAMRWLLCPHGHDMLTVGGGRQASHRQED